MIEHEAYRDAERQTHQMQVGRKNIHVRTLCLFKYRTNIHAQILIQNRDYNIEKTCQLVEANSP